VRARRADFRQICGKSEKTAYAACIDHYSAVRTQRPEGRRCIAEKSALNSRAAGIRSGYTSFSSTLSPVKPLLGLKREQRLPFTRNQGYSRG
jgi:hypothetical protein